MAATRVDAHGVTHAVNYIDVDGNVWNKGRDSRGHYVVWMRCGIMLPASGKNTHQGVIDCADLLGQEPMTWTDEHGMTHEVATIIHANGTVVPMITVDSQGIIGWMCCGKKTTSSSSSLAPINIVDCMTCLVKETR